MRKIFTKNITMFFLIFLSVLVLVSCDETSGQLPGFKDPNEDILREHHLYEDIIDEDEDIEKQVYEIYLEEKKLVEDTIKEELMSQDFIKEVHVLETFYIPPDDPYKNFDASIGQSLFDNVDLNSLLIKGAVGAGAILTVAVISVVPFVNPISVAVVTVAKNALPYAIKGAAVGTIAGATIGATMGASDVVDPSKRTSALIGLGLSTAALITTIVFPPAGAAWGAYAAITAASIGFAVTSVNTYKTFKRTDSFETSLENLNWDELGYSIAESAISGAADGFMIGAISGAVLGAAKSFEKVNGKTVLVDSSTFDPNFVDDLGRSNIDRMKSGLSPIGKDGRPVNLHHLDQTDTGAVVELMESVHRENYYKIHSNTGQMPSQIDRPAFNTWRKSYWQWRAANL